MKKTNRSTKFMAAMLAAVMVFQLTFLETAPVFAADEEEKAVAEEEQTNKAAEETEKAVEKKEEKEEPEKAEAEKEVKQEVKEAEPLKAEEAEVPGELQEQGVNEPEAKDEAEEQPQEEAPATETESQEVPEDGENGEEQAEAEEEDEEGDEETEPITVTYDLKTPSDASFVPEIKGIDGNSEVVKGKRQTRYSVRGLSRNLYQTQKDKKSAKISYEFMGWKTENGTVLDAATQIDLTDGAAKYDKNKDGVVKMTATWNNTFGFRTDGKYRYTTFSIYNTGKIPTAVDNNAGNYISGIYGTVAYPGNATEPLMKNWKSNDAGRVVVNQDSNGIGIDAADEIIRDMTNTPVSNYYDSRNGNEAAGYTEYEISIMDFPSDAEVMDELRERILGGLTLRVIVDGETKKITASDLDDFDAAHYTVKWFSVKYQNNGIHIDGIVVPRVIEEPEPEEEPAAEDEPKEEEPEEPAAEEEPKEEEPEEPAAEEEQKEDESEEPAAEEKQEEDESEEPAAEEEQKEDESEEPAAEEEQKEDEPEEPAAEEEQKEDESEEPAVEEITEQVENVAKEITEDIAAAVEEITEAVEKEQEEAVDEKQEEAAEQTEAEPETEEPEESELEETEEPEETKPEEPTAEEEQEEPASTRDNRPESAEKLASAEDAEGTETNEESSASDIQKMHEGEKVNVENSAMPLVNAAAGNNKNDEDALMQENTKPEVHTAMVQSYEAQDTSNETGANRQADPETTSITETETPLATGNSNTGAWALINLILVIMTAAASLITLKKCKNQDNLLKAVTMIPVAAAVISFLITENMSQKMMMTDEWTVLMAVIFAIQAAAMIIAKKADESEEDAE